MKNLLALFVFIVLTTASKKNSKFIIKKCCPLGQELNYELLCINSTKKFEDSQSENSEKDEISIDAHNNIIFPSKDYDSKESFFKEYSWFPFFSIIDSSNLKPVTNIKLLEKFMERVEVEFGEKAECLESEKDTSCFRAGFAEQFRLILYPDEDMRLYISKKSSHHNEANFDVEIRDCFYSNKRGKEGGNIEGRTAESLFKVNELRTFPLENVCIDRGPEQSFFVEYCPCEYIPCLRKCCRDNEVFDEVKGKCTFDPVRGNWRPRLQNGTLMKNYYLLSNNYPSTCKQLSYLKTLESLLKICESAEHIVNPTQFYLLEDGRLQVENSKKGLSSNSFCGENVMINSGNFLENTLLACAQKDFYFQELYISGMFAFLSGFFLLSMIIISFLCASELKNSFFSRAMFCHNLSIILGDFIWELNYMLPVKTYSFCIALNLTVQYCFMSSFFWMNIISLVISLQLRKLNELNKNEVKFLWCGLYGWGAPLIVIALTLILQFAPYLSSSSVKPYFDCSNCLPDPDSLAVVIFFYAPTIALILFNAVLLFWKILQFRSVKKLAETTATDFSEKLLNQSKKRLIIFLNLLLITGFSWIVEVVLKTSIVSDESIWLPTNVFSFLRSFFIFLLFTCKKKKILNLLKKLKCFSEESFDEGSQIKKISFSDEQEDIKRREKILRKQITQTFRSSSDSSD